MFRIGTIDVCDSEDASSLTTGIVSGAVYVDLMDGHPFQLRILVALNGGPLQAVEKLFEALGTADATVQQKLVLQAIEAISENHAEDGSISMACVSIGIDNGLAITRSEPGRNLRFAGDPGFRKTDGQLLEGDPTSAADLVNPDNRRHDNVDA